MHSLRCNIQCARAQVLLLTPRSDDGKPWARETLRAAEPIEPLAVPGGRLVRTHMRAPTPAPAAGGRTTHAEQRLPPGRIESMLFAKPCDEPALLRESIEVRASAETERRYPCMLRARAVVVLSAARCAAAHRPRRSRTAASAAVEGTRGLTLQSDALKPRLACAVLCSLCPLPQRSLPRLESAVPNVFSTHRTTSSTVPNRRQSGSRSRRRRSLRDSAASAD